MISILLSAIIFGLSCAIIGCATHALQLEPILNWWFLLGEKIGKRIEDNHEKELWFYRPIWGCEKCFSGQLCMYSFILWHTRLHLGQGSAIQALEGCWLTFEGYGLFCHILAIASSVVFAIGISFFINQIKKSANE